MSAVTAATENRFNTHTLSSAGPLQALQVCHTHHSLYTSYSLSPPAAALRCAVALCLWDSAFSIAMHDHKNDLLIGIAAADFLF